MYYAKVQGKTLAELKQALATCLRELEGHVGTTTSVKVTKTKLAAVTSDEEEMEEVDSPFGHQAPSLETDVEEVDEIDTSTVVDNEVDSEGIPWDSRIHASTKAKVGNGRWKARRGVDEAVSNSVKAELRARVGASAAPVVENTPVAQPTVATPAPAMPSMNMNGGHTLDTFRQNFAMVMASLITEKKITQDYVNELKKYFAVPEIWMINDEQKAMVFDQFVQYGFVTKVG